MTALPTTPPFSPSTSNNDVVTFFVNLRAFLADLLGTDGTAATALATLGALLGPAPVAITANTTLTAANRGQLVLASNTITLVLPAVGDAGAGWSMVVSNTGSGVVTLDGASAETVDGAAAVALPRGRTAILVCTGTAWVTAAMPGTAGGPVLFAGGAAATPGLAVDGDQNTGIGSITPDELFFSAGGAIRALLSTTVLTLSVPVLAPAGNAAAPGYAFAGSPGTGIFRPTGGGTLAFSMGGTEVARFDGRLLGLGTTSPGDRLHIVGGATDADSRVRLDRASDDILAGRFHFRKARGTPGSPTVPNAGDNLGNLLFSGYDGAAYGTSASIVAVADAAHSAGSTPGRFEFRTAPAGSSALSERFRLDEAGGKFTGRIEANGAPFWGRQLVIANNAVAVITPPFTGGEFLITVGGGVGATVTDDGACADLHIDCGTTPFIEKLSGWATRGTLVATSYAVLTGTTGTVGFLTVSPQNNGTFLVENRLGASKTVRIWGL